MCKAIFNAAAVLVAVHHTFSQRYNVTLKSTNSSSIFWEQNIEKPEVLFDVKWCSGKIIITLLEGGSSGLCNFFIARRSSPSAADVRFYKMKEAEWHQMKDTIMNFDCQSYHRLKTTWIRGEISLWHIRGSTWNKLLSWYEPDQNIVKKISTIKLRSSNQADWRLYYNNHTTVRNREICINF